MSQKTPLARAPWPGLPVERGHVPCLVLGVGHGGNGHPRTAVGLGAQEHDTAGGGRDPPVPTDGRLTGRSEDVCRAWSGLHKASATLSSRSPRSVPTTEGHLTRAQTLGLTRVSEETGQLRTTPPWPRTGLSGSAP